MNKYSSLAVAALVLAAGSATAQVMMMKDGKKMNMRNGMI